jgi:cytochrome c biogenesis protein CcmG/thiol:disulfide interchange protein DsbE
MRGGRRLLGLVICAAVIVALFLFGFRSEGGREGRVAPALPSTSLNGPPVTLAAFRGKPVFVVFWASWCGPCHDEAPALERFSRSAAGRGHLVGVDWNDPQIGQARTFIRHYRWTFPVLRDSEGFIGGRYGLANLPTTFLIDASGRIRETLPGPQTEHSLQTALSHLQRS